MYKSRWPRDRSFLPSEGHCTHQTCDDCITSSSTRLKKPIALPGSSHPFRCFIAFITRFPAHTKLAPVKEMI